MALSTEEIAAAERMHHFVRGYPNLLKAVAGRGHFVYLLIFSACAATAFYYREAYIGVLILLLMIVLAGFQWAAWLHFRAVLRRERTILQAIEREHGDELPWVAESRQLARHEALEEAVARAAAR